MKKWFENRRFSGLNDEMYMFQLAQARGNGVGMPNTTEKTVFRFQETFKLNEISVKKQNIHETGRELSFLTFDQWDRHSFSARFSL